AAGLAPLRVHDLRHTSAALAIEAEAHPKAIQQRLGHSTIQMTLDRYGHLFPSLDEELAQRLDAIGRVAGGKPDDATAAPSREDHEVLVVAPEASESHVLQP